MKDLIFFVSCSGIQLNVTCPPEGLLSVARIRIKVVFPAPFLPISPNIPFPIEKVTLSKTVLFPYVFFKDVICISMKKLSFPAFIR